MHMDASLSDAAGRAASGEGERRSASGERRASSVERRAAEGFPSRCTWMHHRICVVVGGARTRQAADDHRCQGTLDEGSGGGSALESPPRTATRVANLDQRIAESLPFSSREMTDWCKPLRSARSRWLSRSCSRRLRTSRPMVAAPLAWSRSRRSSLNVSHDIPAACSSGVHHRLRTSRATSVPEWNTAPDASTCITEKPSVGPGRRPARAGVRVGDRSLSRRARTKPPRPPRTTTRTTTRPTTRPRNRRRSTPGPPASARRRWRPCSRRRRP